MMAICLSLYVLTVVQYPYFIFHRCSIALYVTMLQGMTYLKIFYFSNLPNFAFLNAIYMV